jgi:hypothetical protein
MLLLIPISFNIEEMVGMVFLMMKVQNSFLNTIEDHQKYHGILGSCKSQSLGI